METSLHVLSFSRRSDEEQLGRVLDSLHIPFVLCGPQWLRDDGDAVFSLQLVLARDGVPATAIHRLARSRCFRRLFLISAGCADTARDVMRSGDDFLIWPCHVEELHLRIVRLISRIGTSLTPDEADQTFLRMNLVGQAPVFRAVLDRVRKIAGYDAPTLLEGETGTGKELVARSIHYLSRRAAAPFTPVNCGSLPDSLIENELFGHRRGAYTDAREDQPGLVELAEGGTLFFDELEALSEKGQVTLLRFLQDREFRPLGDKQTRVADIRIIGASNASLSGLVASGRFRSDLFYRLSVVTLSMPPLRDRRSDISLLANHFLGYFNRTYNLNKELSPNVLTWMCDYDWPGNVRELENFLHRFIVLEDDVLPSVAGTDRSERRRSSADRRKSSLFSLSLQDAKARVVSDFEQSYVKWVMAQAGGNVTRAARQAGKERRSFGRLLKKYGAGDWEAEDIPPDGTTGVRIVSPLCPDDRNR